MLTDTHVHLDLDEFAADLPEVLRRSQAVGVARWIVPAIRSAHWPRLTVSNRSCSQSYIPFMLNLALTTPMDPVMVAGSATIRRQPMPM